MDNSIKAALIFGATGLATATLWAQHTKRAYKTELLNIKQKEAKERILRTVSMKPEGTKIYLDGQTLTIEKLMALESPEAVVEVLPEAWKKVEEGRQLVEGILDSGNKVYGINTGFGSFANVAISREKLAELQENLLRSHAAGVGSPLTPVQTRRLLALRINVLAKGRSGISPENLRILVQACNAWCLPWVPEKGTLGASGDLAPLAHLALGLMGEGKMWSRETGWGEAGETLRRHNITPIKLGAKEGLAMINGTQLIVSLGAEAVARAENCCQLADIIGSLTLESLLGTIVAFDESIHSSRPHKGQLQSARRIRSLLRGESYQSEITESHKNCGQVQDAYTLRCMPQVHGICSDTVDFVKSVLVTEMNSATDNPMVIAEKGKILSGGNFHGEYPAKVMDYLAIGVHEIASISERRIERLVNNSLSAHLPAFLVKEGGLNSGFMIAHCTAAALVSENKVLCHPSSVDSISTSAAKEDHVSMGGWAARKALKVVENVEYVLAIELLASCQAIEFLRPLKSTPPLEDLHALVRTVARPWDQDRYMHPDIEAVVDLVRSDRKSVV